LDFDAAGPPGGLVEHGTARLRDGEYPRLRTLQQPDQPWVGGHGAQRGGIATEDNGVQLRGTGQQYQCRGVRRGT
jgi:hypothetical protein